MYRLITTVSDRIPFQIKFVFPDDSEKVYAIDRHTKLNLCQI
jgi:hypothetical protein